MGYRRHFNEEDMSKVFGREEDTDFMSYDETVEFLSDLLGIDDAESKSKKKEIESDAEERAKEMGKIPGKKKTQRLFEIEDEVTEDIIVKKIKTDGDINKKDKLSSKILKKNVDFVKRQAEKEGITLNELIKMLKDE
jgi:glucose-6-phosphate isomerase